MVFCFPNAILGDVYSFHIFCGSNSYPSIVCKRGGKTLKQRDRERKKIDYSNLLCVSQGAQSLLADMIVESCKVILVLSCEATTG